MKKEIILTTFLIFFTSLSSSTICLNSDDVILQLSDSTNAHGAIWDESMAGDYPNDICYSDFFDPSYTFPPGMHNCIGSNKLISLSSNSNAHADSSSGYPVDVCFGDFICEVEQSPGTTCNDINKKVILRLSDTTNAHLATSTESNYPVKICCSSSQLNPLLWEDSTTGLETQKIRLGESVVLKYKNYWGGDTSPGWGVPDDSFNIVEKNQGVPNDIIQQNILGSPLLPGNDFIAVWLPSTSDLALTPLDYDQFKFKINSLTSPDLDVSLCGDNQIDTEYGEVCDNGDPLYGGTNGKKCGPLTAGQSCNWCESDCLTEYSEIGASSLNWLDLNGLVINKANEGDTVKLYFQGGYAQGLNFEIKEDDSPIPFFEDFLDDDIIILPAEDDSGDAIALWTIPSIESLNILTNDLEEFYFNIGSPIQKSPFLEIIPKDDDPLVVDSFSPTCGTIFNLGDTAYIDFNALDKDDLINIKVTINDGTGNSVIYDETEIGGSKSISHDLGVAGTTNIKVEISNTKGDFETLTSNVIVIDSAIDGEYVAACIKESTPNPNSEFQLLDASETVAYSNQGGIVAQIPTNTLTFTWEFSDGKSGPHPTIATKFYKYLGTPGDNFAKLKVTTP